MHEVFISGATGYLARAAIPELIARGHRVTALVRPGSEGKVPQGCRSVPGNALDASTFAREIRKNHTFVHLVGVAHPSPAKAQQFRTIDLVAAKESIRAATGAGVEHFVYLSVAHPAPLMKAYIATRMEAEEELRRSGLPATILRPWYVLGPGHRWPYVLLPMYAFAELIPPWRETARRLRPVTLAQMTRAIVAAVERQVDGVVDVPAIRALRSSQA
jgi:uncharacterized protein YbjT (DUF2867 family)